jgi:hypothetical protein
MGHGGGTQSYPITEKGIEYPLAVVCVCVRIPRRWNNKSLLLFAEKLKKYRKNKRMMTIGQATTHTHTGLVFPSRGFVFYRQLLFQQKKKAWNNKRFTQMDKHTPPFFPKPTNKHLGMETL